MGTFSILRILEGDLDALGTHDAGDIDGLTTAILGSDGHPRFDLNGDGVTNRNDRVFWVKDLRQTFFGDANLDGEFNSGDLVRVFSAGKYETGEDAGWAEGDWNGNGLFTSSDMVAAFVDGGYEQGPNTDAAVVPEPTALLLLMAGLIGTAVRGRRSQS